MFHVVDEILHPRIQPGNFPGMMIYDLSRRVQAYVFITTVKQLGSQRLFQGTDILANRRLRHMQHFGRSGKTLLLRDSNKYLKSRIHFCFLLMINHHIHNQILIIIIYMIYFTYH
ncbi:hypothetical protein D3C81_1742570 [compost metagenome]